MSWCHLSRVAQVLAVVCPAVPDRNKSLRRARQIFPQWHSRTISFGFSYILAPFSSASSLLWFQPSEFAGRFCADLCSHEFDGTGCRQSKLSARRARDGYIAHEWVFRDSFWRGSNNEKQAG